MQFASNFLGHFALVANMRKPLAAAGGARVVSVSSTGHLFSPVVFDDLHYRFRPYDPMTAYGQSKTATVLLAVGVHTVGQRRNRLQCAESGGDRHRPAEAHRRFAYS